MNSVDLTGKRILLFSQYFFGYEKRIKDKMVDMGALVDLFDEMSVKSMIDRAILKISTHIFDHKTEQYYFKILEKIKQNKYDYVLFIDCEMPTKKILAVYREKFPTAKFCLHMWDSIENLRSVRDKFSYFDYITTFDRNDAQKYGLKLRPLFYSDEYATNGEKSSDYEYDLCFIGTIHSDRYRILKTISKQAESKNLRVYYYLYLQSKFIYYFYKATKKEFKSTHLHDFQFEKKSASAIAEIVAKSKVIIDIQHPAQTGLTMRTLEMVGMGKKFITTNTDICNYDFYNSNNIMPIDRRNPNIDNNFFDRNYVELPKFIYDKYYIGNWIKEVLGIDG